MTKRKFTECHRCRLMKPTVKPRLSTYGIYDTPRTFTICDSCHDTLRYYQKLYNPQSLDAHCPHCGALLLAKRRPYGLFWLGWAVCCDKCGAVTISPTEEKEVTE